MGRSLPGFAERQLAVPRGSCLTDAEVVEVLMAADAKKRAGGSPVSVVDDPARDAYQVLVPKTAALSREEIVVILTRANEAAEYRFADLALSWSDARLTKNWLTLKDRGMTGDGRLTIQGPPRRRMEF